MKRRRARPATDLRRRRDVPVDGGGPSFLWLESPLARLEANRTAGVPLTALALLTAHHGGTR